MFRPLFIYGVDKLSVAQNVGLFVGSILLGVIFVFIVFKIIFWIVRKKNKL